MSSNTTVRAFEVRHLQLARAAFAALAALMITFSPDHSATIGLSIFSGFAIATSLVLFAAAWLVYPVGQRWAAVVLAILALVAGMASGVPTWRSTELFIGVVAGWALASGIVELIAGLRDRNNPTIPRGEARDAITIAAITLIFAIGLAFVPSQYALQYYIEKAGQTFTLTGTSIGVGIFGGYAAILAVYLGIAGFSPRRAPIPAVSSGDAAPVDGSSSS